MQKVLALIGICAGASLSSVACAPVISSWIHNVEVAQGNIVSQDMLADLRPGMSREQVRAILGTPLLVDPFHPERWNYIYHFVPDAEPEEQRHFTVIFENDALARIEGDVQIERTGQ
jgi:outer membrane protein assembly factor BamE